jgi:hypothetical protein
VLQRARSGLPLQLARGSEIFQVHGTWNIGNVVETELEVERKRGGSVGISRRDIDQRL